MGRCGGAGASAAGGVSSPGRTSPPAPACALTAVAWRPATQDAAPPLPPGMPYSLPQTTIRLPWITMGAPFFPAPDLASWGRKAAGALTVSSAPPGAAPAKTPPGRRRLGRHDGRPRPDVQGRASMVRHGGAGGAPREARPEDRGRPRLSVKLGRRSETPSFLPPLSATRRVAGLIGSPAMQNWVARCSGAFALPGLELPLRWLEGRVAAGAAAAVGAARSATARAGLATAVGPT